MLVVLMTNEKSHEYLSKLKEEIPNVLEETELLINFGYHNDDGIEHFQIMRALGDFAAFRICTAGCYFKQCNLSLVMGECHKYNDFCLL